MKMTILGGGGFRVPLVYGALLRENEEFDNPCTDVVLYDEDLDRVRKIEAVLRGQAAASADAPRVTSTDSLDEALAGTDFIFSAIRVGGLDGRSSDERSCLDHGVLGQETTGAAGLLYGLRTLPEVLRIAHRVAEICPDAWFINFTNPAGMVTEAMSAILGERVIGICDSPIGLCKRVARVLDVDPELVTFDYFGLNHLGWLGGVITGGHDLLPGLLQRPELLDRFEEGKLFGADWLRTLGAIPNEYLHYYYNTRDAIEALGHAGSSRGEFLANQQQRFYQASETGPEAAYQLWQSVRRERESTYMAESREATGGWERDQEDLKGNGYEGVALTLMRAIAQNEPAELILNVPNNGSIEGLPDDAIVEVICDVDARGPRPKSTSAPNLHQLGLMLTVKSVERDVIAAVREDDSGLAWRALGTHPLVDSTRVARALLSGH
ncbi:6-phospho-beta-glucosidase [Saxibacter everestensis]|uniref:6-phospho-beta-glucosidase n=1 Tax=Saxibacter everestensis TaxID=2909229 RepID=A0ABY8QSR0_9MICO|nr:6-phospho-beta-glucosidase [Brevibacteriaceae bacterium ZFBP1038]